MKATDKLSKIFKYSFIGVLIVLGISIFINESIKNQNTNTEVQYESNK